VRGSLAGSAGFCPGGSGLPRRDQPRADAYRYPRPIRQHAEGRRAAGRSRGGLSGGAGAAPDDADIHLPLGHALKIQGRRSAALERYRRAAELAPFRLAPQRELSEAGERASQERLFEAQQRLGSIDALIEMTHQLLELRTAIDRIAETLPNIQAQLAFRVACYDQYRERYGIPDLPPASRSCRFAVLLPADGAALEALRAQISAITDQTHRDWVLRVIGSDPAQGRVVEQMVADPRKPH
jgi:hypothetical protein